MELIRNPVCPTRPSTTRSRGASRNAEEVCLEPVWLGGSSLSDPAALAGCLPGMGAGAGSVEEAPRYAMWLQVKYNQALYPLGGKEAEGSEITMVTVTFTESFFLLGQ